MSGDFCTLLQVNLDLRPKLCFETDYSVNILIFYNV